MSGSEDQCGYVEDEQNLPGGIPPISCEEPTWDHRDRCLWHAETSQKPIDILARRWEEAPTRIDGVCFENLQLRDRLDFSGKILYSANFEQANLTEANFRNSQLDFSNFTNATLRSAKFNTERTSLIDVQFEDAKCVDTRFQYATLHNAEFQSANLSSAKLQHSDAADAIFANSKLHNSKLICANFRSAELESAELYEADCGKAIFESASLKQADLRGASFVDADLFDADIRDAEVDHETEFGSQICREFSADRDAEWDWVKSWTNLPEEPCIERGPDSEPTGESDSNPGVEYIDSYESDRERYMNQQKRRHQVVAAVSRLINRNPLIGDSQPKITELEESEGIYLDIKQVFRENPVPEQRRQFNIREKETKRKTSYINGSFSWLRWSSLRWSMQYGESAKQVIIASLGMILVCSVLYPIWGLRFGSGETIQYSLSGDISADAILSVVFYSLRRLISPTDGSVTPIGPSEWIALGETAIGALLIAVLVFVLGRRATA